MLTAMRLLLLGVPADVIFSAGFEASPFGPFAVTAAAGEPAAPAAGTPDFDAVMVDAERFANASAVVDRMAPLSARAVAGGPATLIVRGARTKRSSMTIAP